MKQTLSFGTLRADCYTAAAPSPSRICYILVPMPLADEAVGAWAQRFSCPVAVVSGMDWNADLTPWPAPALSRRAEAFGGRASGFLARLTSEVLPQVERTLAVAPQVERTLVGISLSGLFALWAWTSGPRLFRHVASVSGSLWYDGFADWQDNQPLVPLCGRAYLSLGSREGRAGHPRFRAVQEATARVVARLKDAGAEVTLELQEGVTHFSPVEPRLQRALACCLGA